jgi:3-hydroxypropanoate dehydrogenase
VTTTFEPADLLALDPAAQDLLFRAGRTANTFSDEPVSDAQLEAIYDLMKFGPTALNAQTLRIVAVRSDEARARLVAHMAPGNRAKTESAPLVVVLAADTEFHENLPVVAPFSPNAKDNFADAARREGFARNQAWLASGYFIMAVRAAGLAAGPMSGFDSAGVDADLLAGTGLKSFMVVNIGKPGENPWFDRLPRLDPTQVISAL